MQAMSQLDQWQQPQPAQASDDQRHQGLSAPRNASQPPQPPSYQQFGGSPWAIPPTPGALWQPLHQEQPPPSAKQLQQSAMKTEHAPQLQSQGQQPERQHPPAEQPPLVRQDWSWLDSLPTR